MAHLQDFKLVHWEFNQSLLNSHISSVDPMLRMMPVNKPGSKTCIGILFRFTVRVSTLDGQLLGCIGEEVYIDEEIANLSIQGIKEVIAEATKGFNTALLQKSKDAGQGMEIDHTVKDQDAIEIFNRVRKK